MINKQKVKNVIKNILDKEAVFQYGHCSSAKIFDTEIRKHGFIPNIILYHQYKFPIGFNEESFENYIMQQIYMYTFDINRIINPEKYIQKFFNNTVVSKSDQQEYLSKLINTTKTLSDEEKEYIVKYFQQEQSKAFIRISNFLPELKKLNPEIQDINPKNIFDFFDLYIGMTSQFFYEDIKYFCSLNNHKEAEKNQDKIKSVLGFSPSFYIAPHRVQQLINGIIFQKQIQNQNNI